jgi:L,D-peptidoglycan transpeptidase YkuD (ErfK/YbiS/YcfS/YnhG family)|tara:strand:+ start:331 stop:822 length:492 start_codon:yes stop_codon:yes gene_type:complete
MHILLQNKKIYIKYYKLKCAIGKRGINIKKREGDNITPRGKFALKSVLFRQDRVADIKTKLTKIKIEKNMGWCDDPNSKNYNKLIRYPFKYNAEKLYKKDNIYDIIITIDYNYNPIIKNKGSAIFIHIAKNNYSPTRGCIAISKRDMKKLLANINKNSKILII